VPPTGAAVVVVVVVVAGGGRGKRLPMLTQAEEYPTRETRRRPGAIMLAGGI